MAVICRLAAFWTRVQPAIFVNPSEEGSAVFPIKVGFSCKAAAASFREKMEIACSNTKRLVSLRHQHHVVVFDENCQADSQVRDLENEIQQTTTAITEETSMSYCWEMVEFVQRNVGKLAAHPFRSPADADERKRRHDLAVMLHNLNIVLQLVRWPSSLDIAMLYRVSDTKARLSGSYGRF
ncbi:unnamed protein product [Ostreobium quekettii]|uniref:Uncharacterized protein n=1 Tax=Ostreobium quekettii TaxID=121088 RepID=A0A8S1J2E0_9CHLO|nr:unnamed protein product [Ostreobium quekettii]